MNRTPNPDAASRLSLVVEGLRIGSNPDIFSAPKNGYGLSPTRHSRIEQLLDAMFAGQVRTADPPKRIPPERPALGHTIS
jgi:hypothetical protein